MDDRLKQLGQQYGGTFGGNGIAPTSYVSNPNKAQVYFDSKTNQHFTLDADGRPKTVTSPSPSTGFLQKIRKVGAETVHIAGQVGAAAGKYVVNTPKYVYQGVEPFLKPLAETLTNASGRDIQNIQKQQQQLESISQGYSEMYKAGKMSKEQYVRLMKDNAEGFQNLSHQAQDIQEYARKEGNAQSVAMGAAETAATILSAGSYRAVQASKVTATGRGFVLLGQQSARTGVDKTIQVAATKVQSALEHIPAFRDLVAHNLSEFTTQSAKQLAGETTSQYLARNAKDLAVGMLIKRPIVYQTNIESAQNIYHDILKGDVSQGLKDAAWVAAQAVSGGPLGWAARHAKDFAGKVRLLSNGKGSFIDAISKRIGDGSPAQIANYLHDLRTNNPAEFEKAERTLRIAQEIHLQVSSNDVEHAADAVTTHYEQHGIDLISLSPKRLVDDLTRWSRADEIARKLSPKDSPTEYVAVRWDKAAKTALANRIEAAGDNFKAMADALASTAAQPGVGWGNNPILMGKIVQVISQAESAKGAAAGIRAIETVATIAKDIPKGAAKRLAKLGYSIAAPAGGRKTPKVDYADTRKLVTAVTNGSNEFDQAVAAQPQMEMIASQLRKFGLSPEANTATAYDKLSEAMVSNLEDLRMAGVLGLTGDDPARGAKFMLSRLQEYINKQAPNAYLNVGTLGRGSQSALQDVRQMNVKEIQAALQGITKAEAKAVQKAVLKSYTDVPLEFRGLGVKAFDYAYRVPGAKTYFRIQSALRYTYNPFFRTQEIIETKTLSHLKANNLVWMKPRAELNRVAQLLDDSKIFTSGYTGEATQDLTIGRIHANLLDTQRRDLAGLALDIAEKKGITVEQMVRDNPEELADALKVIVQYPSSGILNSHLARTLNVVFFPMRYNLKVAGIVAKEVSKLPPTIQTAVIHSMFKASSWLKSPEGIQWQSDNTDAIQIFSYFSVSGNVQSVLNLLHGKPDSVGSLGLLGGLPFGAISQILDAEGIIHLNTPYVNPATGDVLPDYIPQTTKARAAVALEGMLNTMFSYPGRVIGLPGKAQFIRDEVNTFLKTGNGEYLSKIRTEDLTPLQKKWVQVLGNPNVSQDSLDELYTTPAPGQFNWYTLPPMNLPKPVKVLTKTEVAQRKASGSTKSAKKKALPIPQQGSNLELP